MTGNMTVDLGDVESTSPFDPQNPIIGDMEITGGREGYLMVGPSGHNQMAAAAMLSPRYHKMGPEDDQDMETANFLRICGLCKRRLAPGRDIYMYRGDTAFCSPECREVQMKQDERNERRILSKASESLQAQTTATPPPATSTQTETVSAA